MPKRFRSLHRKLEQAILHIEHVDDVAKMLGVIVERLCHEFEDDLGLDGGRIYSREDYGYMLRAVVGDSAGPPLAPYALRPFIPPRRLLADGFVFIARGDPDVRGGLEQPPASQSALAAIGVGHGNTHIITFSLKGKPRKAEVLFSLSLVRHVINLKLQQRRMAGIIDATRIVQEGILPQASPAFSGFDIGAAFRPADVVSGDLFDYLPISDGCLGIAITDSSGHGLPAALLARDVITALRTMAGRGGHVASIVQRVNQVVQRAALSGTFASLFYGQLSNDGTLEYCNAGHEQSFIVGRGDIHRLAVGGMVLGPISAARYEKATVTLQPGDLLVLHTDGIVERMNAAGQFYGSRRLEERLSAVASLAAQPVAAAILADADAFADGMAAHDDMTAVVVKRL